jgi:RNA polymerase sigma-70 factor (ECF subfamily)
MATGTDRELIERARSGDAEAFATFVRRHQRRIFRLAVHMVRSAVEAEDLTQETFVRAYQAIGRFDGRSEPFTWVYRICVNLSLNAIRARKTRKSGGEPDDPRVESLLAERRPSHGADPAGAAVSRQQAEALYEGIDSLSETLRTTLVLVTVDGMPHDQAAAVLGCPEGTVAWRVHEARRKLKAFLEARGFGGRDDR